VALFRSPQKKNHFALNGSGELRRSRRAEHESKKDTKVDRRLDAMFPSIMNKTLSEPFGSEGPNDSVHENLVGSRRDTAQFP